MITSILGTDLISNSRNTINANFSSVYGIRAYKTINSSVASNTLISDTELVLPVQANDIWTFQGQTRWSSAATPDFKIGWTVPSTTTMSWGTDDASTTQLTETDAQFYGVSNTNIQIGGIYGVITVGSIAGNVVIQFAQSVTTPSSVSSLLKGSNIIATKLN